MSVFDETLDDVIEQSPLPAAAGPEKPDPFGSALDAVIGEDTAARSARMRVAGDKAQDLEPDRAADIFTLARRYGLPADMVERNFDDIQRRAKHDDTPYARMLRETPALAEYVSDPIRAAAVKDDLDPLATLETTVRVVGNSLRAAAAGVSRFNVGVWGVAEQAAEVAGNQKLAAWFKWARQENIANANVARGTQKGASDLERAFYSGFESVGLMIPGTLASIATGSPALMLGTIGATTEGEAYGRARDFGKSVGRASLFGATQAAVEVATEYIPARFFLKDLATNAGFRAIVLHQIASEIPGEQIATLLQDLDEWITFHPEQPFSKYLEDRPAAAFQTLVATITAVGATTAIASSVSNMAGDGGRVTRAEQSKDFFKTIAQTVGSMTSIEKHPDSIQTVLAQATADSPIEKVYAPLDTFTAYFRSINQDPAKVAADLTGDPQAYERASRTGADLAIPMATYAATIATSEHNEFFVNELRLGPDEMNVREATAFKEQQAAAAQEQADQTTAASSPTGAIRVALEQQLEAAGVERSTAAAYVDLAESTFGALSSAFGVDPLETFQRYGLAVERPSLATPAPTTPEGAQKAPPAAPEPRQATIPVEPGVTRVPPTLGLAPAVASPNVIPARVRETNIVDESGRPLGGYTEQRVADVGPPAGQAERRAAVNAPIDVMANPVRAAQLMRAENPAIDVQAEAMRQKALAAGRIAEPADLRAARKGGVLDKNVEGAETTQELADASTERDASRIIDQGGSPAENRIAASDPGSGKKAEGRASKHLDRVFGVILDSAKQLDPAVDDARLREEFDFRVNLYLDQQQLAATNDNSPHEILRAVAQYGGLSLDENAERASEIRQMFGGTLPAFGAVAGVRGVFRKAVRATKAGQKSAGWPIDVMLQSLQGDNRFGWIENVDMLLDAIDEAMRHGVDRIEAGVLPGTEELRDVGIRREKIWWPDAWAPADLLQGDVDETTIAEAQGDTSFDITEFDQSLFDEFDALDEPGGTETIAKTEPVADKITKGQTIKFDGNDVDVIRITKTFVDVAPTAQVAADRAAGRTPGMMFGFTSIAVSKFKQMFREGRVVLPPAPTADTLATGEVQPRLPEASAVREQEIATPAIAEAPFTLTAPTAKPGKKNAGQTTLFQTENDALTRESVNTWADDIKAIVGPDLKSFVVNLTLDGDISLDSIIVARGAQRAGLGTKVVKMLTRFADQHGRRLLLTPGARDPIHGTTSTARLVKFYKRFGFVENKGRNKDFSISARMFREPTVPAAIGTPAAAATQTATPAFKAWFGESKIVDDNGEPLRVYHGTTGNFESFDRERANPESDFGAGIYFSNNPADVGENYAGIGPDLTQKLQLRIERLEQEFDYDEAVKARVKAFIDEHRAEINAADQTTPRTDAAIAIDMIARQDLGIEHGGATMPVYLKIENPAIVGGENESTLDYNEGYVPEEQRRIGVADPPYRAKTPGVNWSAADLQDSGTRVTADTVRKDYGGSKTAKVYQTWIAAEDMPSPTLAEVEDDDAGAYDWSEIRRGGSFPPAKVRVSEDGEIQILDGNHRINAWEEANFSYFPAWVIDERADIDPDYDEDNPPEETGKLVDFIVALRDEASRFNDGEVEHAIDTILEEGREGGIGLSRVMEILKADEQYNYFTDDAGNIASNEITRLALEQVGFDGIIDHTVDVKFGSQRRIGKSMAGMDADTVHYIAFEPAQIKSAIGNRGTFAAGDANILYQEDEPKETTLGGKNRRGVIRFGPERQFTISLLEKADLSTFLHESGHLFLEVFGDLADQFRGGENLTERQQLALSDYDALLKWLGVERRGDITEVQHEQFARGFEAYLMEGKAPSATLRSAFARFRAWLIGIYRSLKGLRVDLSDDVRRVLDRMVATDDAIAQAEAEAAVMPLFTTAESAGMTPAEFELYRGAVSQASNQARETLEVKLLAEIQREQQAAWKTQRVEINDAVRVETYDMPVYQAIVAMQRGTKPNGGPLIEGEVTPPLKLSRKLIVDRYGKDRLKRLPRPFIYSKDGGLDPDAAATMFGYTSGDELLNAIEQAEPMERRIERETDRRMIERHGSILLDGTLQDKAQAAVANDFREEIVRAELRALGRLRRTVSPFVRQARQEVTTEKNAEIDQLAGQVRELKATARGGPARINAALPPANVINEAAKLTVARMRVREIRPHVYWSAARRAGQKALEAAARQDFETAIAEKQHELMSLAVFREASRVLEDVEARTQRAKDLARPAAQGRLGAAGGSFLEQVNTLLDRYEFARQPGRVLDRRESMRAWAAALQAQGLPVEIPDDVLDDARRINYRELTTEELIGVSDALDHIVHLSRLKNKFLKQQAGRELEATAVAIGQSIRANYTGKPREEIETHLPSEERKRTIKGFFAMHRKLASLVRQIDGFKDGGPLWEAIVKPLNDAGDREAAMNADATRKLAEIVQAAYPGREKVSLYEKQHIPAIGRSFTKMGRLAIAFNYGNADGRQRLRDGYKWNDQQISAVLDTLDERDWRFVQATWDFINSYWPEIAAKQERVTGVAPAKVEAVPVPTKFGTFNGGYFPLKYNERLEGRAGAALDLEAANLARQAAYVSSTTRRGHTKERVQNVKLKVRTDFGVLFEHVTQVIHDLSHHEALIDVGRVLGRDEVRDAIYETHGELIYGEIKDAVRDVAFGVVPAVKFHEKAINHLRTGATIAGLGWNLTTAMLQPLGLTQSMVRIGPKWVGKGMSRWLRDAATMENTVRWINERSTFMKLRGQTQQREISEIRQHIGVNTGKLSGWVDDILRVTTRDQVSRQGIADSFFFLIQQMQRVADVPTWIGQYEKSMDAGETEARAIALADQAVIDAQGGGQVKDLAGIQRGGPLLKLWTNFYSFFNTTYNLTVESTKRTNFSKPGQVGRLAVDYLLLYSVPATLGYLVRAALRPGDDDDLKEGLIRENLSYLISTIVGVRELQSAAQGYAGYEGPAGARAFATAGKLLKQVQQGEADAAFWRALNDLAGMIFHYPAGQTKRTIEGIAALVEGETTNPGAVIVGAPSK